MVEDDPLKASRLTTYLSDRFPEAILTIFGSYQSGLKGIRDSEPDFVILDMTLPTFDRSPNVREGRIRPLGGYELMRKVRLHRFKTRIIVVTQLEAFGEGEDRVSFAEINARCLAEFPEFFLGGVQFKQGNDAWKDAIYSMIIGITKKND